jgi:hypothetical protein
MKLTELTLPQWAFVEGSGHDDDSAKLSGRNVILHIRSASVFEVVPEDDIVPNDGVPTYQFRYGAERFLLLCHYAPLVDDDDQLRSIMEGCAEWFCSYCAWEDDNITMHNISTQN